MFSLIYIKYISIKYFFLVAAGKNINMCEDICLEVFFILLKESQKKTNKLKSKEP